MVQNQTYYYHTTRYMYINSNYFDTDQQLTILLTVGKKRFKVLISARTKSSTFLTVSFNNNVLCRLCDW